MMQEGRGAEDDSIRKNTESCAQMFQAFKKERLEIFL